MAATRPDSIDDRLGDDAESGSYPGHRPTPQLDGRAPIDEIEAFLAVARERHFGRAAQRMFISQSRVSRLVASFERRIGAVLFERTSRVVRLTPLAVRLNDDLSRAHSELLSALHNARRDARDQAGALVVGFGVSAGRGLLNAVVDTVAAVCPEWEIGLVEVPALDPYSALRASEVDVLLTWFADPGTDVTYGPVFANVARVVAVGLDHELATRSSVSVEELADHAVVRPVVTTAATEAVSPSQTPSGRAIRGPAPAHGLHDTLALVARGRAVHATVPGIADIAGPDIVLVPLHDLPPLQYGPVWLTARENARIRKFAAACLPSGPAGSMAPGEEHPSFPLASVHRPPARRR